MNAVSKRWPRRRTHRSRLARNAAIAGYLFISPWLIGFFCLTLGPMIASLYFSLTKYGMLDMPSWVGLENYSELLKDAEFWQSLKVTSIYTFSSVPLHLIFGFMIALMLNQNAIRALSLFRTIYYLPAVVSGVAVAVLWAWIFQPKAGILNGALALIGIKGPMWLLDPTWALPAMIVMSLWGVGGGMVIYLAGLQGIPTVYYEAASIDGANAWQRFWSVTLPMMTSVLFFNLIMGIIGSFQVFTQAYVMTRGGPMDATLFYILHLYVTAFRRFRMGYASAMAWMLFVVILALTSLVIKSSSAWVYYAGETIKA